jgi:hypothetical protein
VNHRTGKFRFGLYRQWSSYSSFGTQEEQSQWSLLTEIINFKRESKLQFEFPVYCQNNLHSIEQKAQFFYIQSFNFFVPYTLLPWAIAPLPHNTSLYSDMTYTKQ